MRSRTRTIVLATGIALAISLCGILAASAEGDYPADYKPSKPAATGETNVLARFGAVVTYMNDKLNATGGKDSPVCYRSCLTAAMNDVLKCIETKSTYTNSESCEKDGAQKMSACDPKCQ
jgi:hypothetical protein